MKKSILFISVLFLSFVMTMNVSAQKKLGNKVNNTLKKVDDTKTSVDNAERTINSSIETIKTADRLLKTVTGKNKKNLQSETVAASTAPVILISINNIDIDDEKLGLLSEELNKVKGVATNGMNYDAGTALLKIGFSGTSMDLWKSLPKNVKSAFKIIKITDNSIELKYGAAIASAPVN